MQLLNYTTLPAELLRPLLALAGRAAGARSRGVLACVEWTSSHTANGNAHTYVWWRRKDPKTGRMRRYNCEGAFVLRIPRGVTCGLSWAEDIYSLGAHEWKHVADAQQGEVFADYHRPHGDRPHEIRAGECAAEAMLLTPPAHVDAIIALAIAGEEYALRLTQKRLARAAKASAPFVVRRGEFCLLLPAWTGASWREDHPEEVMLAGLFRQKRDGGYTCRPWHKQRYHQHVYAYRPGRRPTRARKLTAFVLRVLRSCDRKRITYKYRQEVTV